jgi:putative addiction module antidote
MLQNKLLKAIVPDVYKVEYKHLPQCKAERIITNVITYLTARRIMQGIKLTQIGNSVGMILPKEVLARLKLEKGDTVYLTDTPGGVAITPHDPSFEEQLDIGRQFMREYRDTFNALAK